MSRFRCITGPVWVLFTVMKRTMVDSETGTVRCPKCGAAAFVAKRTVKGKLALGLMAPKRAHCLGCGTALKAG